MASPALLSVEDGAFSGAASSDSFESSSVEAFTVSDTNSNSAAI